MHQLLKFYNVRDTVKGVTGEPIKLLVLLL